MAAALLSCLNRPVQNAAQSIAVSLGSPIKVSDWSVVSDSSFTATVGEVVDFSAGGFTMTLVNGRSSQIITLKGYGAGAGMGLGLSPIDVSGDPQVFADALEFIAPNSPSGVKAALAPATAGLASAWKQLSANSPVFLVSSAIDSEQLFGGWAQIISAGAGAGAEYNIGVLIFFDVTPALIMDALFPIYAPLFGGAIAKPKALAFFAGPDALTNISAGVSDTLYRVVVN